MWPQKWKASAFCARIASSTKPPPATARMARPVRARNPRRELAPATASLNTGHCVGEERLELVERVEGALGEDHAVGRQHDRVGAPGHGERLPRVVVRMLVEGRKLDAGVVREQPQRRLQGRAERAPARREDGDLERRLALEALDEGDAAAELRTFVVEGKRGFGGGGAGGVAGA